MADGVVQVENGALLWQAQQPEYPAYMYETMRVARTLKAEDFRIAPRTAGPKARVRAILVQDGLLESEELIVEEMPVVDGSVTADTSQRINKIAMIDRVFGTEEIGVSFVQGFDIADGAIGTSANVFNQNVVVVGSNDEDMAVAANAIVAMRGGFVAVQGGKVIADFPTPLNGLVSDLGVSETRSRITDLIASWRDLGCQLTTPQINLEFVTLVTIPRLRISTKGLALIEGNGYTFVETIL